MCGLVNWSESALLMLKKIGANGIAASPFSLCPN